MHMPSSLSTITLNQAACSWMHRKQMAAATCAVWLKYWGVKGNRQGDWLYGGRTAVWFSCLSDFGLSLTVVLSNKHSFCTLCGLLHFRDWWLRTGCLKVLDYVWNRQQGSKLMQKLLAPLWVLSLHSSCNYSLKVLTSATSTDGPCFCQLSFHYKMSSRLLSL